ncbi:MAG: 23S rRNA (adenine(2503)-C(2))-methyltransferase RlmN [Chthoniobacterales bacterium]|nr:23S rRNA (adenine(2503)-C(2))-methyltransferase RlmN [Chthoniobacterales bacterium]
MNHSAVHHLPILLQSRNTPLLSFSLETLTDELQSQNIARYRAHQILEWVYQKRNTSWHEMLNLPIALREDLEIRYPLLFPEVITVSGSRDTTQKFLLRLADQEMIETVLIPASPALYGEDSDRRTLCVSSQVGCAYGCKFCASGLDGFKRNLSVEEIVSQVLLVEKISGERINNIVFMGMGEPFANFDHLTRAIEIINAPWGIHLAARKITVSTSGLVPRIRDFADLPQQVRLAISLHGATDEVRSQIMPINKRYPLAELMEACAYYVERKKQLLTFEYILIAGVNDQLTQARALADHALRLRAKVNLIPYNKVEGLPWDRPSESIQRSFLAQLRERGVAATIRREKGHDIDAACGQLRRRELVGNADASLQSV